MQGSPERRLRPSLEIGRRRIGAEEEPFIVAEIGTSHGGDRDHAHRLIDAAAEARADCAKFQLVIAEEIIHPRTGTVSLPGGEIALYERFRSLERSVEFYADLKDYSERNGLLFLCAPFGVQSARMLRDLGAQALKVASPELNHVPLLREVGSYSLPLIVSTGVSTLGDIEQALRILGGQRVALLHCVTAYPAPPVDYNLRLLGALEALFGVPVGVSDHSLDPVIVPALGAAMGAAVIEKHLTLSKSDGGLDDPVALNPQEFRRMTAEALQAHSAGLAETIERLESLSDRATLERVLGTGTKQLAPSEEANYERTNRSLHALVDIPAGTVLNSALVGVLRTEKKLRPGLSPYLLDVLIGRKTVRDIPAGEGIVWDDLLAK